MKEKSMRWRNFIFKEKLTFRYHLGVSFMGEKKWKQAGEYLIEVCESFFLFDFEAEKIFEKQENFEMISKCYSLLSDVRKHEKLKDEAQRYSEKAHHYSG